MKKRILFIAVIWLSLTLYGTQTLRAEPTDFQQRPIPMGVSISTTPTYPYIAAGTAGMLVHSWSSSDLKFILSNNHVIGAIGPSLCPNTAQNWQTWVLQPGTLDIGFDPGEDPQYLVGLTAYYVPIQFGSTARNLVDAAIAYTLPDYASKEILGIGAPTPQLAFPIPGMTVIKSGRSTGVTTGTIQSINTTVMVSYGSCGTARFVRQVVVGPSSFSAPGDSGAVVLENETLKPVGLLFAGGSDITVMNNIVFVYLSLGVFPD